MERLYPQKSYANSATPDFDDIVQVVNWHWQYQI
jgi:hypothetical protein